MTISKLFNLFQTKETEKHDLGGIHSEPKTSSIYQTKWGYVPYSYAEYRKLKRLNVIFQKARTRASQWERWVRKEPHNRVIRKKVRNEKGQIAGHEVVGPSTEPITCDLFSKKLVDVNRKPIGRWFDGYIKTDNAVEVEYQKSRRPVTQNLVPKAEWTESEIDELLQKAEEWFSSK